jgi:tetratricopeptide (TPR) repeat protein
MPDMASYTRWIQVLLGEAGKYFFLLLFSVLAIRLWRRLFTVAGGKPVNLLLAGAATILAAGVGYFSVRHSLSLLYSGYGERAFDAGNLPAAYSLFQKSSGYWSSADAVGKQGVCLLLSGRSDEGIQRLAGANALRHGRLTPFEEFYEGLYYFFQEQPDRAVPLLERASVDPTYEWSVVKLLAVIALDRNQVADARRLMAPFLQAKVADTDCDHAYVVAALDLVDGKRAEAAALLDRFPPEKLSVFWRPRFEKLRVQVQNQTP